MICNSAIITVMMTIMIADYDNDCGTVLCSMFVFFDSMKHKYFALMAIIHGNKHKKLIISLVISPEVMKPDFFVAPATTKTFKIFCLIYSHGHITFMENPIIRIAAKFQYKKSHHYALSLLWTPSHGLEVVRIERVVFSYKNLEAGRLQLM